MIKQRGRGKKGKPRKRGKKEGKKEERKEASREVKQEGGERRERRKRKRKRRRVCTYCSGALSWLVTTISLNCNNSAIKF